MCKMVCLSDIELKTGWKHTRLLEISADISPPRYGLYTSWKVVGSRSDCHNIYIEREIQTYNAMIDYTPTDWVDRLSDRVASCVI